jgi:DNA-binding beta-propeller fold protein YncE
VSLLVQLPVTRASATPKPAAGPTGDILWLFGVEKADQGYAAHAVRPDGTAMASLRNLPHATARSSDGTQLATARAADGATTTLDVYSAATGKLTATLRGRTAWPTEPDLVLVPSATGARMVVVGTCFQSTQLAGTVAKQSPHGGVEQVPVHSFTAHRAVEIFDLGTGRLLSHTGLTEVPLGSTCDAALDDQGVRVFEHGPAVTRVHSYPTDLSSVRTEQLDHHAAVSHIDRSGGAYYLTTDSRLGLIDRTGKQATISLRRNSYERITAKPFRASVLSASPSTVVIVDAGRRYIACVDTHANRVLREQSLSTAGYFAPGTELLIDADAIDAVRRRIYVPDRSGVAGGVWVHDAESLQVLDRWHSDVAFRLAWVAPSSGVVYLHSVDGPVAVHDSDGKLLGIVPAPLATARAL